MTLRKSGLLIAIVALLLGAFSVSAQDDEEMMDAPDDAKIGVIGPFTGDAAAIGQDQLSWARLAVQDFNEETGWNVEIVEVDTELEPATATTAVETIIGDDTVYGAVGPAGSQVVGAVAPQFVDAGLVHVSSASTDPALTQEEDFPTFFRVVPTDAAQGPKVASFVFNDLGAENLFIIDDQSSYAIGLGDQAAASFEEMGGTVVDRQSVTQEDTDFSSLVTRVANSDAEAVFFAGQLASQAAQLATQMLEQGLVLGEDIDLIGSDGIFSVDDFITNAGGTTEGAYVSSFPDIRLVEESVDILERYNDEFESALTSFGPPTYIATRVVLEAMQRDWEADGELSREDTLAEVAATEIENSILGVPVSFDENGDVQGINFFIYQVQDGEFVIVPTSDTEDMEATEEMEPEMESTEEADG